MKYIDRLSDFISANFLKRWQWCRQCNKHARKCLESIDLLEKSMDETQSTINNLKKCKDGGMDKDLDKLIRCYESIHSFFEFDGKLILLSLEFYSSFKFLLQSKSNWEYRFFARRIYTLMYETRKGFLDPIGRPFHEIISLVGDDSCKSFDIIRGEFCHFIDKLDKKDLKEIRNRDVHKEDGFLDQKRYIENMSIKESLDIILDYRDKLMNLQTAMMSLLVALNNLTVKTTFDIVHKTNK